MQKRSGKIQQLIILVVLIVIVIGLISQSNWFWRMVYPLRYGELISESSQKYGLDPALVAAMIFVESKFKPTACSHKGARGLMQIMPETGQWIAEQLERTDYQESMLYEPALNIEFGSWYLASLKREFNHQLVIVLAAYNAGRGNVARWLEEDWDGQQKSVSQLPFDETRNYVNQILKVYQYYQKLYQPQDYLITD